MLLAILAQLVYSKLMAQQFPLIENFAAERGDLPFNGNKPPAKPAWGRGASPSPGCGEERTKGGKTSAEKQQIKSRGFNFKLHPTDICDLFLIPTFALALMHKWVACLYKGTAPHIVENAV